MDLFFGLVLGALKTKLYIFFKCARGDSFLTLKIYFFLFAATKKGL